MTVHLKAENSTHKTTLVAKDMKTMKYKLLIVFFIIPMISKSQDYCGFIQNIQNYQDSVKLKGNQYFDSSTFDLNKYLSFFDKIKIDKGYKIGFYYMDYFLGGYPLLYSYKGDLNLAEMDKDTLSRFIKRPEIKARNFIYPKNSKLGYIQYLFFAELGENFALKWHSYASKKRIICSPDMLNRVISDLKTSEWFSVDSLSLIKLKDVSTEITFDKNDNYYIISWLEHRTHFAISRCTYMIERNKNHTITKIKEERLLEIIMNFVY